MIREILTELDRAMKKYPEWPNDPLHALAILGEEFGELTQSMLQMCYEPEKSNREQVELESIQTAAMAIRLAMSLSSYEYSPQPQHSLEMPSNFPNAAELEVTKMAENYYRSAVLRVRPKFVPVKIRLIRAVGGLGSRAEAGVHDAHTNQFGALSVIDDDGELLGVKPREFEPVKWGLNPHYQEAYD